MSNILLRFGLVLFIFSFIFVKPGHAIFDTTDVTITVTPDTLTYFKGIGFSVTVDFSYLGRYTKIYGDPLKRKAFIEEFIGEAGFKNVVLWGSRFWLEPDYSIKDNYVTWLKDFQQYGGIKHIMFNPTDSIYDKEDINGPRTPFHDQLKFQTNLIKKWDERGIDIYATTYKNKPNTNCSGTYRQHPDTVAMGVAALGRMLDTMGYGDVKISGPTTVEWYPKLKTYGGDDYDFNPGDTELYLNAILNNADAMNQIDAFDKQTYGDGITEWWRKNAEQHDKEIWQMLGITESQNTDNDPSVPLVVAASCLADINHGTSIWNTWLSYRLLKSEGYTGLYHHLKNISKRFHYGNAVLRCVATPALPTADMHWNYYNFSDPEDYLQPELVMAAGVNPDQSWVLGLVNTTGIKAQHQPPSLLVTDMNLIENFNVTVDIPALKDTARVYFSVYKSYPDRIEKLDQVVMENGKMKIPLLYAEHLVLHSDSMSNRTGQVTNTELLLADRFEVNSYPNPFSRIVNFSVYLPDDAIVSYEISDITGRKIFTSGNDFYPAGKNTFQWQGNDWNGQPVLPGIYLVKMHVRNKNQDYVKNIRLLKI